MTERGQKLLDGMVTQLLCNLELKYMPNDCDYYLKANMKDFQRESSAGN